jgi:hypothetical protein
MEKRKEIYDDFQQLRSELETLVKPVSINKPVFKLLIKELQKIGYDEDAIFIHKINQCLQ